MSTNGAPGGHFRVADERIRAESVDMVGDRPSGPRAERRADAPGGVGQDHGLDAGARERAPRRRPAPSSAPRRSAAALRDGDPHARQLAREELPACPATPGDTRPGMGGTGRASCTAEAGRHAAGSGSEHDPHAGPSDGERPARLHLIARKDPSSGTERPETRRTRRARRARPLGSFWKG